MRANIKTLMLDSGAFTVWTQGKEVNLPNYIEFCKEFENEVDVIVSLDVISGKNGSKKGVTKKDLEITCQTSWDNYMMMLDAGLPKEKVVPVFHQMDDFKWLEKYMEFGVPYLGLSSTNRASTIIRQMWLDTCMNYTCDKEGFPLIKTHGFAVTALPLIIRYPWWSCDSTAGMKFAIYGSVLIPHRATDGTWNFMRSPMTMAFSARSKSESRLGLLSPMEQRVLIKYLDNAGIALGKSEYRKEDLDYKHDVINENVHQTNKDHMVIEKIIEPGVSNDWRERCAINNYFYQQVQERLPWPQQFKHFPKGKIL